MADKTNKSIDSLNLTIKNGTYEFSVSRNEDTKNRVINDWFGHFEDVILSILNYHGRGIMYYNGKLAGSPINSGNIVDGNPKYDPDLLEWKLKIECELPETQKKILEEVVSFHNNYLSMREYLPNSKTG